MNRIRLEGCVVSEPKYSHKVCWEKFYTFDFETYRKSGAVDTLKCVISETMIGGLREDLQLGICGEVRTRNDWDETGKHCRVEVFVFKLFDYSGYDENKVDLHGFTCKEPVYRETPNGRQITDLLVASNREQFGKSDYIPCITWGRSAVKMANTPVGTEVKAQGRLQSREYLKRYEDGTTETRVAYELSCSNIEVVGKENESCDNDDF